MYHQRFAEGHTSSQAHSLIDNSTTRLIQRGRFSSFTSLGQDWSSALLGASLEFYEIPFRAYFSWLPHQSLDIFFSDNFMHYGAPQGLILHLLTFYAYILFLSAAFHYRATRHGNINHSSALFPDVSHSSHLCCAWENTDRIQAFDQKQYWTKPKWYFASVVVYVTAFTVSIYKLFNL